MEGEAEERPDAVVSVTETSSVSIFCCVTSVADETADVARKNDRTFFHLNCDFGVMAGFSFGGPQVFLGCPFSPWIKMTLSSQHTIPKASTMSRAGIGKRTCILHPHRLGSQLCCEHRRICQ